MPAAVAVACLTTGKPALPCTTARRPTPLLVLQRPDELGPAGIGKGARPASNSDHTSDMQRFPAIAPDWRTISVVALVAAILPPSSHAGVQHLDGGHLCL